MAAVPPIDPMCARIAELTQSLRTAVDVMFAAGCFGMVDGNCDFVREDVKRMYAKITERN